jgi:[ribosomal protein S5]-alanine N-acetyltransferase
MDIPLDTCLTTARCLLRCVAEEDLEHVWTATRHPGFNDGMNWEPPACREDMAGWTKRNLDNWRAGVSYVFTICSRGDGGFIGRMGLHRKEEGVWNLGYWIHPRHWSQGYATEAGRAVLAFGFQTLGAARIEAPVATWNMASRRVLEKLGMTHLRDNPQGLHKHGRWVPEAEYAIDQECWRKASAND